MDDRHRRGVEERNPLPVIGPIHASGVQSAAGRLYHNPISTSISYGHLLCGGARSPNIKYIISDLESYRDMAVSIVLPIKKVFSLVDSKIVVEIKDEKRKFQGRLIAVDEYLNLHMDETAEYVDNQRGRNLGTVIIRGNNILTISPLV